MTSSKLLRALVGAVSLITLSGPAFADVFASASLSNFKVKLTDLRPQDGVAPSLTMLSKTGRGGLSSAYAAVAGPSGYADSSRLGDAQFDPVRATRWQDGAVARSGVSGDGSLQSLAIGSMNHAVGRRTTERSFETLVSGGNAAYRLQPTLYRLSPFTRLVITADVKLKARTTLGTYRNDGVRTETAGAFASLQLNSVGADGSFEWPDGAGDSVSIYIPGTWSPHDPFTKPARRKVMDQLSATITNNSPHAITVTVSTIASTDGNAAIALLAERSGKQCASETAKRALKACGATAAQAE